METHLIDAMAEAVVRVQLGRPLVRIEAECDRLGASGELAEGEELGDGRIAGVGTRCVEQRAVAGCNVVILSGGG